MNGPALNPFHSSTQFKGRFLHLGLTGSVAVYKLFDVLRGWLRLEINVSVTLTKSAEKFVTPLLLRALGAQPVYTDMFGEETFAHLEPGESGGAFIIAPASADFIARAANGFANDMLSCQVLAFPGPIAFAPAMNMKMWLNPAVQENIIRLKERCWELIRPASGEMACGDVGVGRLAQQEEIFLTALKLLSPQDLADVNLMITLGPTKEYWDCARYWSNPSSGKMGCALATAAWLRGADVTVLCNPEMAVYLPQAVKRIGVLNAREMLMAARDNWPRMDWGIFCAAVADFRPDGGKDQAKFKKAGHEAGFSLSMLPNPDILATLAREKSDSQKILAFAAESALDMNELAQLAKDKLKRKKADVLAANRIGPQETAFAGTESALVVVDKIGNEEIWPIQAKADSAWRLLTWLSLL